MKGFAFSPKSRQRGIAALFVAVILLLAVTLLVMFASRVALLDQRTSANEYRHGQAFAMAEAGLEQAAAFLRENPILHGGDLAAAPGWENHAWTDCAGVDLPACDDESVIQVLVETIDGDARSGVREPLDLTTGNPVFPRTTAFLVRTDGGLRGIGVGESDDGTGEAVVQVDFGLANVISPGELPPLMAPAADLSGNFNIVANPNGGGPGVPISVWTEDPNPGPGWGNWKTCDHGDFRDSGDVCMDTYGGSEPWKGCGCSESRSVPGSMQADIVIAAPNELPNPFVYVFGDPSNAGTEEDIKALKQQIKTMAEASGLVLPSCAGLTAAFNDLEGSALVWIEGSCSIADPVGSRDKPITLVVEQDLTINATGDVWGLVVGGFRVNTTPEEWLPPAGALPTGPDATWPMKVNGTPYVHGSLISEGPTDITNGTYYQVYDQGVFDSLLDDSINTQLTKLSYSWRDFRFWP